MSNKDDLVAQARQQVFKALAVWALNMREESPGYIDTICAAVREVLEDEWAKWVAKIEEIGRDYTETEDFEDFVRQLPVEADARAVSHAVMQAAGSFDAVFDRRWTSSVGPTALNATHDSRAASVMAIIGSFSEKETN